MGADRVCVYIPVDEYRELVQAKRDADLLKAALKTKLRTYCGASHEELKMLCEMFGQEEESGETE